MSCTGIRAEARTASRTASRTESRVGRLAGLRAAAPGLLALLLLLAGGAGALRGPSPARAQDAFPPRRGVVAGALDRIDEDAITVAYREKVGEPYGLEGLVAFVEDCGEDVDLWLDRALVHYGLAPRPGEMVDDALAWLYCEASGELRFTYAENNRYGRYLDPARATEAAAAAWAERDAEVAARASIDEVAAMLARAPRGLRPTPLAPRPDPPAMDAAAAGDTPRIGLLALLIGAAALVAVWAYGRLGERRQVRDRDPARSPEVLAERVAALEAPLGRDSAEIVALLTACESLGPAMTRALNRRHEAMGRRYAELARRARALAAAPAVRREGETVSEAGWDELETLLAEHEALRSYVRRMDAETRHAGRVAGRAEGRIEEARAGIAEAELAYARAAAPLLDLPDLVLPAGDEALRGPRVLLERAEAELAAGRPLGAGRAAEDAEDLARRAARAASRIQAGDERLTALAERFALLDGHAPESWRDVRGAGTEAEASLAQAAGMLRATLAAPLDRLGEDPAAGLGANLALVSREIARFRTRSSALSARIDVLEAHRRAYADEEAAARERLLAEAEAEAEPQAEPQGGAGASGEDREEARAARDEALLRAEDALVAAADAAQREPPDWDAARHALLEAELLLDPIGRGSRAARGADRRRRLALAEALARADLARAEGFLGLHERDIGPRARGLMEEARAAQADAEGLRRRAQGLSDTAAGGDLLRRQARVARRALRALEAMEADLAKAERRRPEERPASAWEGPVPGAPRETPFPGRFGGWPAPRQAALAAPACRWGAPRRGGAGQQALGRARPGW